MDNQFTVDYFIDKFSAIPENKWTQRKLYSQDMSCSLGHCKVTENDFNYDLMTFEGTDEAKALISLFSTLSISICGRQKPNACSFSNYSFNVTYVNDGDADQYPQPTPKQRILAALNDIKKAQQPSNPYPLSVSKDLAVKAMEERIEVDQPVKEIQSN